MHKKGYNFNDAAVLVVGDIMLDRYIWGKVRRISPEAPVPVVHQLRTTETLGGAGNVAFNLTSLGCQVTVIGVCGDDATAQVLRALLDQKGIADRIVVDPCRPTITKTRIMAQKQQILRLDDERVTALAPEVFHQVQTAVEAALSSCRAVIVSDYGKGMFTDDTLIQTIIGAARKQGVPVLVDPKGSNWQRYRGATGITPNTAEFELVVGQNLDNDQKRLITVAEETCNQLDLQWLLVTRGAQGMCLVGTKQSPVLIAAQAREVYDVSGAGDTVIATMAAALAVGQPLVDAAQTANIAAGIVVGKVGTQPILASELSTALKFNSGQQFYPYSAAKMTSLDAALAKVKEWRSTGSRTVFTNGCFDLLHPGHISLLYQARALGDRLVVGLNTDASIKRLKGSGRPILAEQDRAAMLSALACVDLVVHFDQDTPLELIKAIQPDILVKGSDYTPDQVVGKEVVEAYGGCVKLVDLVQGYSTTRLAQKVISQAIGDQPFQSQEFKK